MRFYSPYWSLVSDSLCNPCLLSFSVCTTECKEELLSFSRAHKFSQVRDQMWEGQTIPGVCCTFGHNLYIYAVYWGWAWAVIMVTDPVNHGKMAQSGLTKLYNSMVLVSLCWANSSQTVHNRDIIMSYYVIHPHCQVILKCQLRITTCGSFCWYLSQLNNMISVTVDLFCGFTWDV